jgi:hypothetical protein
VKKWRFSTGTKWGFALVVAALLIAAWAPAYNNLLGPPWQLLDEPMRPVSGATISSEMNVPSHTTYDINLYATEKVKYVDCLFGMEPASYEEDSHRCDHRARVVDVTWQIQSVEGVVLAKGVSGGTCCAYTSDDRYGSVVFTKIDAFTLMTPARARLELHYNRDITALAAFTPRLVVERTSEDSESLGWLYGLDWVAAGVVCIIGALVILLQLLRSRRKLE